MPIGHSTYTNLRKMVQTAPFAGNSPVMNSNASPLMSMHAVVIDTETTGLDARTARLVEIAVVHVNGLEIERDAALDQLLNPGVPVPKSSSQVHGLSDSDVKGAPRFAGIASALDGLIDGAVVIGHNVGYDLAVLDREYAHADRAWTVPRALDVRALARLAAPDLASYSLDALCDWLGVEISTRHRALPDALATAQLFVQLVPLLRSRGIRTLAEAEYACRHLPGEERLHQLGGWIPSGRGLAAEVVPAIAVVDSYPFQHRVRDLTIHKPVFVAPSADLKEVARAVLTVSDNGIAIVGSATEVRGLITATGLLQASLNSVSVSSVLSDVRLQVLPTAHEDEFLYRALGRLRRVNSEHLGVLNQRGEVIGTLSASDLLHHRVTSALVLSDDIDAAETVADLGRAWAHVPKVVSSLLRDGVEPSNIAGIVSAEIRALTARAAYLSEKRMRADGKGAPPCAYAVLVLGSAGRGDSLLSADQDNAIIHAAGDPGGTEDIWFAELGTYITDILNEVGIPFCSGGVMAKNPGCRHSAPAWRQVVADWVDRAQVEDVLAADIFFDGVPVYGEVALADDVFDFAFSRAAEAPAFIMALASFAKSWYPPIGMLGRLILDGDGRLDLKRNGLLPIVTAARTLALKHAIRPTSTLARLVEIKERSLVDGEVIDQAVLAYTNIVREVLAQQVDDTHRGIPVSARVQVASMPSSKKAMLKTSMQAISMLIGTTLNL